MQKTSNRTSFPKMKRVVQRTASHCGPAVLEMLTSFLETKVDQDAFVNAAGVEDKLKRHGMTVSEMGMAVHRLVPQATFWYKRHATIGLIEKIITKYSYPVGIEWQGIFAKATDRISDDDDGHYSVVTRVDRENDKLVIADPYKKFRQDRLIAIDIFKTRWWDLNEVTNPVTKKTRHIKDIRMLFIVTPKTEKFPKALGLRRSRK